MVCADNLESDRFAPVLPAKLFGLFYTKMFVTFKK